MIEISTTAPVDDVNWRQLLGSVPDAVIVSDAGGRIVYVNAVVEPVFGYKPEALIGQSVDTLVPPQVRVQHIGHRAGYHAAPKQRAMGFGGELRAVRADGTMLPVAISLGFIKIATGNLVIAIVQDRTELRKRDRHIKLLNERVARDAELKEVNKELEAFSYSVSHDLRAPLRAIDGFSQVLEEEYAPRLDDYGKDCLDRIRHATQRMGQLIDDLLGLSRITRSELVARPVNLTRIAAETADMLKASSPEQNVEFVIEKGLKARGDERLLRIAMENLIGNALKFSAGRDPARIEVGQIKHADNTAFFVRDNGAGFDMGHAGKMFGAFQRMNNARDFPGTGIGLATVKRVINRHSGDVWAESEPDKGATFYFTLFKEKNSGHGHHIAR